MSGDRLRKAGIPKFTHHDFRHFFATTCIESGVDIPTISRWLGHGDGGALAMRVYGHLQVEHSLAMIKRVNFEQTKEVSQPPPEPKPEAGTSEAPVTAADDRRAIAKAKTKYSYPWWVSENPLEVFWGQLHEEVWIVPVEKFLETAKQAMGRQVLKQEFADRLALRMNFRPGRPNPPSAKSPPRYRCKPCPRSPLNRRQPTDWYCQTGSDVSRKKRSRSSLE